MIIQQDDNNAPYKIQRYEGGRIWINDKEYTQSVAIKGAKLVSPWYQGGIADLKFADFNVFDNDFASTIILGTGATFIIPSMEVLRPFLEKNIGVEYMDTKMACYTYTALSAENRDVAVFLLL